MQVSPSSMLFDLVPISVLEQSGWLTGGDEFGPLICDRQTATGLHSMTGLPALLHIFDQQKDAIIICSLGMWVSATLGLTTSCTGHRLTRCPGISIASEEYLTHGNAHSDRTPPKGQISIKR